ncbi:GLPGLI family protein [Spongiimicrobium salis]|uniref:GLPGLI family protein n=1 Tax=Spongiimicrobium salis TaxID=1667022 RepID=UPI00374CD165
MKTLAHILIVTAILISSKLNAQNFKGIATYKTSSSIDIKMDSTQVPNAQMDEIQAMLKKAMQKEFELQFNASESTWKEAESLGGAAPGNSNVKLVISGFGGGDGALYKNTKDKRRVESTDLFGKQFLIKDSLNVYEWELGSETKQIGQYTCYKATMTREVNSFQITQKDDGTSDEKKETKMQTTTAWYTPEIPVNHGPERYWGLPGLILEVNNGNRVLICSKIVLNPKEEIVIAPPTKGKEITSKAFEEIAREKAKEMEKMYNGGGRKKGTNSSFSIKISG